MKKVKHNSLLFLLAGSVLFFSSCNKDGTGDQEFETISFDKQEILDNIPAGLKNSTDTYAQQCYSDIESALDMSNFMDDMTPPEDAVRSSKKAAGDTWQWTVSDGTNSLTFYWSYEEDSQTKYWTMEIQIDEGEVFPYITAKESKDGKQGEVLYNFNWVVAYEGYGPEAADLYWKYHWNVDNTGNYTFNWDYDSNDPSYDFFLNYEVVVNADGSGTIDYYSMDAKYYHMEWDSQGNGSWTYYIINMSGTWSV